MPSGFHLAQRNRPFQAVLPVIIFSQWFDFAVRAAPAACAREMVGFVWESLNRAAVA